MHILRIILRMRTVYWSIIISQTLCTIEYPLDYLWSPPFLLIFVIWYSCLGTSGQDSYANQLFLLQKRACLIPLIVLCYLCNHLNSVLVRFDLIIFCIPVNLSIAFSRTFLPFFTFVQVIQCIYA